MKPAKSSIISIAIVILLIASAGGLGYYLDKNRIVVASQRKTLADLKKEAADMDALQKEYNNQKENIEDITRSLPNTTVDIGSFLQDVNASASISGTQVTIKVMDIKADKKNKDGEPVDVELELIGTYVNTTKFINRISKLPYYFELQNITTKLDKTKGLKTGIKFRLITTYHET